MSYKSFSHLAKRHRIQCLPRPRETWRLVQTPVVGEILGLGHCFRGLAIATNGIIVAIETSAGNLLFGHLQWFLKDNPDEASDLDAALTAVPRCVVSAKTMLEFAELL